jgi:hypothetical protein
LKDDLKFFALGVDSPSPAPGVGVRSLSRDEILVKLFSRTSGEGTSGVADRDPPGVSFWILLPLTVFFRLALEALLPRRVCPIWPSSISRAGVVLRDEFRDWDPDLILPLRVRF